MPAPVPPVHLSTANPDANVQVIIAFFRSTCIDAAGEPDTFRAALAASGWPAVQTQAQGRSPAGDLMPSVWRLDHGQLLHSSVPAPPHFIDCHLSLDSEVAPTVARLREGLRPVVDRPGLRQISADPQEVIWTWRAGPRERRVLTIAAIPASRDRNRAPGRQGVAIHFATDPLPPRGAGPE